MNPKHTEGTWEYKLLPKTNGFTLAITSEAAIQNKDGKRLHICSVLYMPEVKAKTVNRWPLEPLKIEAEKELRSLEEAKANAKLIAQAPDMYQFVNELHEALSDKATLSIHEQGMKLACHNIIRKVEGQS